MEAHESIDPGTPEGLGALIRAERKAQGLRQPDLAAAAGTSVRLVVEVERGKPTAQVGKVLELMRQLGLRLEVRGASAGQGGSAPEVADGP